MSYNEFLKDEPGDRQKMLEDLRVRTEKWGEKLNPGWPFDAYRQSAIREFLRDFLLSTSMNIGTFWDECKKNWKLCPSLVENLSRCNHDYRELMIAEVGKFVGAIR